jgi:hypothetical protein
LSNTRVTLGVKARDTVTGFTGIVTSRIEWLTKCTQYCISPEATENGGKLPEGNYFDETRIEVLGPGVSAEFGYAEPALPKGFGTLPERERLP